jgi:N-acetylglutamate synthase-like GNAT family acetyltransferase
VLHIRKANRSDIPGLKTILDSSELFPSEYLEGMMEEYLTNPESGEIWFCAHLPEGPAGFGYCVPEKLTEGTYNLLAIAVTKELQGKGIGRALIQYIENLLKAENNRILTVDTSGSDAYLLTRKFYLQLDYQQEAVIRDFWKEGEDKIVFWKKL